GQIAPLRIIDREVIEAGRAGRGGLAAGAFPRVEAEMMMVAASGEKGGAVPHLGDQVEAEQIAIKADRPVEIGDLEMNVADARAGWNRWLVHGMRLLLRRWAASGNGNRHAGRRTIAAIAAPSRRVDCIFSVSQVSWRWQYSSAGYGCCQ